MSTIVRSSRRHPRTWTAGGARRVPPEVRFVTALLAALFISGCIWAAIGLAVHALLTH